MSDLTPIQVERKLTQLVNDLTLAQLALQKVRDEEVAAKHTFQDAHRRAMFSPDCPKPSRGGVTVDERNAWVDEQAATAQREFDFAEATRKAAEDHLRVVRDQAMILMSLGKSVNTAYNMAGVA